MKFSSSVFNPLQNSVWLQRITNNLEMGRGQAWIGITFIEGVSTNSFCSRENSRQAWAASPEKKKILRQTDFSNQELQGFLLATTDLQQYPEEK